MSFIDDRKLSVFVHSARRNAEHPGYLALEPIVDLIEAVARWITSGRKGQRGSRPSLPPRA